MEKVLKSEQEREEFVLLPKIFSIRGKQREKAIFGLEERGP